MKVGTLTFCTDQGLSYLAKSFYDAGVVTDVLLVKHRVRREHPEWYPAGTPRATVTTAREDYSLALDFCRQMDVVLFFETPFHWELLDDLKKTKTKTALMVMYECMPKMFPAHPDLIIAPSDLDAKYYPHSVRIDVPVEDLFLRERYRRDMALTFVHNAGNGGLRGRNGTHILLESLGHLTRPTRIVLRSQSPLNLKDVEVPSHVDLRTEVGTVPRERLYSEGDVFVFPELFNGLSLPLQEAYASGMLVMTTRRYPNICWLPLSPLIPSAGHQTDQIAARLNSFRRERIDPKALAKKIDEWNGREISDYSGYGHAWGELHSWEALRPTYMSVLENLASS